MNDLLIDKIHEFANGLGGKWTTFTAQGSDKIILVGPFKDDLERDNWGEELKPLVYLSRRFAKVIRRD